MRDVLKLAEQALETAACYIKMYEDEHLASESWMGSEDEAILLADKKEVATALAAVRAAVRS